MKKKNLMKALEHVPNNKKEVGESLISKMLFYNKILKELEKEIKKNGVIDNFKQGVQEFKRESPALKSYNTSMSRFITVVKQFIDLLPVEETRKNETSETLKEFLLGDLND